MTKTAAIAASMLVLLAACDEKKEPQKTASSAAPSATPSAPPAPPPPAASSAPEPTASASAAAAQTSTKDPNVSVKDPKTEPAKTVKAQIGGTVTLYLPKWAGTSWTVKEFPKPLGKAKEETIPGFAGPSTPAAGFVWKLNDPSLKAGQTLKATLENKTTDKSAPPAVTPFTLTIELVAP